MTEALSPVQNEAISQTDYLKLFMQELTYQDPLKPVDNREFMTQMAEFSALQEARTTNESLAMLLSIASSNQSLLLLQKQVKIKGSNAEGIVRNVQFPKDSPPLLEISINGSSVKKELTEITEVSS